MQVLPDGMVLLAEPNPDSLLAALEEAVHLAHTVDPLVQHHQVNVVFIATSDCMQDSGIAVTYGQCAETSFVMLSVPAWVR